MTSILLCAILFIVTRIFVRYYWAGVNSSDTVTQRTTCKCTEAPDIQ